MADETYRNLIKLAKTGDAEAAAKADHQAKRYGRFRHMKNEFEGVCFYESSFNMDTGTLIRATDDFVNKKKRSYDYWGFSERVIKAAFNKKNGHHPLKDPRDLNWKEYVKFKELADKKWDEKFGQFGREAPFSPVPETIDIAINSWCNFGCSYCYTDATTKGKHASVDLVKKVISGLAEPPYQIAYGGGSVTQHPEFIKILEVTRELGTVPNYTTEGQNLTNKIIGATAQLCGGVALTYHAHRDISHFKEAYKKLSPIGIQVNVHLIADKNICANLRTLMSLNSELGLFNVVLLHYYPEVGRSNIFNIMPKKVYNVELPNLLKEVKEAGNRIAFSEGLLPYFFSRPDIGVDTTMALATEGEFSCFIDVNGRMSTSSFAPPPDGVENPVYDWQKTVFETSTQVLWDQLRSYNRPRGDACERGCKFVDRCATPNEHSYLICKFAEHNKT